MHIFPKGHCIKLFMQCTAVHLYMDMYVYQFDILACGVHLYLLMRQEFAKWNYSELIILSSTNSPTIVTYVYWVRDGFKILRKLCPQESHFLLLLRAST